MWAVRWVLMWSKESSGAQMLCGGMQGIPEFVSKGEQAQLRAESMSRTRSYEKVYTIC